MVEFFIGDTLDCGAVFEKIRERRGKGKRQLLIVPDRFMMYYEKAVMDYLDLEACFDIEVVSFSRLANKTMGAKMNDYLSAQGAVMLLRKVIEKNKKELSCFRGAYNNADFASEIYAVISQIRNSGVSSDAIDRILDSLPIKIRNKTKDIVMLYKGYVEELNAGYTDGSSKLEALTDAIEEYGMQDCDVYISDYLYLSNIQRRICEKLFAAANYCAVFMVCNDGAENSRIYPSRCLQTLIERARACGCNPSVKRLPSTLKGDKKAISEELFAYGGKSFESDGSTLIYVADSAEEEVRRVAREIKRKVVREGSRFMDFAVVCCDVAAYAPIVERVFKNVGINYFFDKKESLDTQTASRLVTGAFRTVARGYRLRDVAELAKNALLPLDFLKVCAFENFCIKYGVEYVRPDAPFRAGTSDPDYAAAEEVRAYICDLLSVFTLKTATAEEYYSQLRQFLQKADFDERNALYVQSLADRGEDVAFNCATQATEKLKDIFSRSVRLLGDCRFSVTSYLNIINSAIASTQISLVPLFVDCVFVGESRESRYDGVKTMFVLGASQGALPPEHGDNGIFAGKESRAWAACGVVVEPDVKEQNNAERLNTLMFLLKPQERLEISYSRYNAAGEAQSESVVVKQLCELLSLKKLRPPRMDALWDTAKYAEYFAGSGNIADELIEYKLLYDMGVRHDDREQYDVLSALAREKYGEGYVDALLGEIAPEEYVDTSRAVVWKGGHTSVSQIELYAKCPFRHYVERILSLHPREKAEMKVQDIGTIIHEVLQRFFSQCDYKNTDPIKIKETAVALTGEVLGDEKYAQMNAIPHLKGEIEELKERCVFLIETLCERMKNSDFEPDVLEEAFGMDGSYAPIKIKFKNKTIDMFGRIDRVDRYGDHITIVDYKSSASVSFSLPNVMYGERIQLFIYMKALAGQIDAKPAGVFYLPLNNKFLSENRSSGRFKFVGFINTDEKILKHFDHVFDSTVNGIESRLYPIKRSAQKGKEGDIVAGAGGVATSPERFAELCDYVEKLTCKAAEEIDDGYIKASPTESACTYCEYGGICAFAASGGVKRMMSESKVFEEYPFFAEGEDGTRVE